MCVKIRTCCNIEALGARALWRCGPKDDFGGYRDHVEVDGAAKAELSASQASQREFLVTAQLVGAHPASFAPQASTLPSFVRAKLLLFPAAMPAISIPRSAGTSNR